MILQRLISEAAKLPDLSSEVHDAVIEFNKIVEPKTASELELLFISSSKQFQAENVRRTQANLKQIEMSIVKAKHAVTDDIEDFV